jgi:hypothetical protein
VRIRNEFAILVMVFVVLGTTGCDNKTSGSQSSPERICPKLGASCTVQFRRDALGASANLPVPPTTSSINGANVSVGGKFSKMNEDWVVLKGGNKGEIWIPRSVILLIEVGE